MNRLIDNKNILILITIATLFFPFESQFLSRIYGIELDVIRWGLAISIQFILIISFLNQNWDGYAGKKWLLVILFLYTCSIIIRAIPDYSNTPTPLQKKFICNDILIYLFPLLASFQIKGEYIVTIDKIIRKLSILVLIITAFYSSIYIGNPEGFIYAFGTWIGFFFFVQSYQETLTVRLSTSFIYLSFLFCIAMLTGRRAASLYSLFLIILGIWVSLKTSKKIKSTRLNKYLVSFVIIFGVILFLSNISKFDMIFDRFNQGFDSREDVLDCYVYDMNSNGTWVFGKGLLGRVYAGSVGLADDGTRDGIESHWLNAILKGGIVYLTLILLIMLEGINNGLRSNNLFCKSMSFFLIYLIIDGIGFGVEFMNFKTFLTYFAIACCHSEQLLSLSDEEMYSIFNHNYR